MRGKGRRSDGLSKTRDTGRRKSCRVTDEITYHDSSRWLTWACAPGRSTIIIRAKRVNTPPVRALAAIVHGGPRRTSLIPGHQGTREYSEMALRGKGAPRYYVYPRLFGIPASPPPALRWREDGPDPTEVTFRKAVAALGLASRAHWEEHGASPTCGQPFSEADPSSVRKLHQRVCATV